jgi:hypothetical protein
VAAIIIILKMMTIIMMMMAVASATQRRTTSSGRFLDVPREPGMCLLPQYPIETLKYRTALLRTLLEKETKRR